MSEHARDRQNNRRTKQSYTNEEAILKDTLEDIKVAVRASLVDRG